MWKKIVMTLISVIALSAPRVAVAGCGGDGGDGGGDGGGATSVSGSQPRNFASMTNEQLQELLDLARAMYRAGNGHLVDQAGVFQVAGELESRNQSPAEDTTSGGGSGGTTHSTTGDSTTVVTEDSRTDEQRQIDKAVEEGLRDPAVRRAIERFGSPETQAALANALANQAGTPPTSTE